MSDAKSESSSPPAWRFFAFGSLMTMFSTYGQSIFIGVFGDNIKADLDLSDSLFGTLYSLATVSSALLMIWAGKRIDTGDFKRFTVSVLGGLMIACLLMAGSVTIPLLVLGIFAMRFAGQGMMSHVAITGTARYFDRLRGRAMIFVALGYSVGDFLLTNTAQFLNVMITDGLEAQNRFPARHIEELLSLLPESLQTWRLVWILAALSIPLVVVPIVLLLLRGQDQRHASYEKSVADDEATAERGVQSTRKHWTRKEVLRDPVLYLMMPVALGPAFFMTGIFVHQNAIAAAMGWSQLWFTQCFFGFAIGRLLASVVSGFAIDRFSARGVLPVISIPLTLGILLLGLSSSPWVCAALFALTGLAAGAQSTTIGAVWAELYGTKHLGAIRAMVLFAVIASTAASPPLVGAFFDIGVGVPTMAWLSVATILAAFALALIGIRLDGKRRKGLAGG